MLSLQEIKDKAVELARARLGFEVTDAVAEDDLDAEGRQSVRVTILLKSKWSVDPPGIKLIDISTRLNSFLLSNGDGRFAYTHYMTAREFSALHDKSRTAAKRRVAAG